MENWSTLSDMQVNKLNADNFFDFVDKSPLDILHRKLLKYVLGVNRSAPNMAIYGDTGEVPLTVKGFTLMVNFWHHLTDLPDNSLAKLALRENVESRTNWLKTVEKFINIFDLAGHANNPGFKYISKEKGRHFYSCKWEESIQSNEASRLKFYKQLNVEHSVASYLLLPYYQRKTIAKLRCSTHDLEIERDRHKQNKKLAEERL